ncbi:TetR family transcriptional regulator [Erwinia sp. CPCC 100877]|nr:TetR family transcriptional regulator [Erwinia sp. CPCC 100877]
MSKHPEHDTREHLLATGEQLCLRLGFTGMGLSELLRTAGVPRGSFYHYFRSKEAFGVEMLKRYYAAANQRIRDAFTRGETPASTLLLDWYHQALEHFCRSDMIGNCLTVKLSAEVCDLSEEMREALEQGSSQVIAMLAQLITRAQQEEGLIKDDDPVRLANILYALWLGASLQAKISRSALPLESAQTQVRRLLRG